MTRLEVRAVLLALVHMAVEQHKEGYAALNDVEREIERLADLWSGPGDEP